MLMVLLGTFVFKDLKFFCQYLDNQLRSPVPLFHLNRNVYFCILNAFCLYLIDNKVV